MINGRPVREIIREEAEKTTSVPPQDLEKCDSLDLQYSANLLDSELKAMLEKGFIEGAREAMKVRGLSDKVFNAVRTIRGISLEKTTVVDLQNMVKTLLRIAENAEMVNPLIAEIKRLSEELSRHTNNRVMVANVAVRAAALADVLQDLGYISRDAMQRAKFVVAKVQVEQ